MATRIYLESSGTPAISPPPNAAWTDTSQFTRFNAGTTKAGSAMTTKNISDAISTQADILIGQWITPQLTAGQTIRGTVPSSSTWTIQIRASETAAANNLFVTWAIYVFNGTTLQSTVVAKRNDATEVATSLTNRGDSFGKTTGAYTTVAGDQLVIEIGLEGDPTSSNTHNGAMSYGSDSATDLAVDDTTTTADNPFINSSNDTLTFVSGETVTADKWVPDTEMPYPDKYGIVSYFRRFKQHKGFLIPTYDT